MDFNAHSQARIATPLAGRYLTQLCKHFQHKVPVTLQERTGAIVFDMGVCALRAEPGELILALDAPDAARLETLRDVVARHLVRFAFREDLRIDWQEAAGEGVAA